MQIMGVPNNIKFNGNDDNMILLSHRNQFRHAVGLLMTVFSMYIFEVVTIKLLTYFKVNFKIFECELKILLCQRKL